MQTLRKPLLLLLALVAGLTALTAAPASAGPYFPPVGCVNGRADNVRYFGLMTIILWECKSEHGYDYRYQGQVSDLDLNRSVALYYYPYGRGMVPGSKVRSTGDGWPTETPSYFGKRGELQVCVLEEDDRLIACAWPE